MTKQVDVKTCECCDSEYRLSYNVGETSGYPKFCPFCSAEAYDDEEPIVEYDDE